jgi:cyclic pyranopterin phosphate synthase
MPLGGIELTPQEHLLTSEEILRLVRIFAAAGVSKVRFTGGEPSLRPDLVEIVEATKATPGVDWVAMTTNAIALRRKLPALRAAGLGALNISLDTLRPERFEELCRRPSHWHQRVLHTLDQALGLGFQQVKLNVVLMRGQNDDEVADFVELTRDRAVNVRFIEYMPFDGNRWDDSKMVPFAEVRQRVLDAAPSLRRLADPRSEVAKNFSVEGHAGSVSFVTSMTEHFCHDCNRVRLMADGNFKVCLFGNAEVSLRDAMRGGASDGELAELIAAALGRKKRQHAGMFNLKDMPNRSMTRIGG